MIPLLLRTLVCILPLSAVLTASPAAASQWIVEISGGEHKSELVTLETRRKVTVTFQVIEPASKAKAAVVLFAGGAGRLRFSHQDGKLVMKGGKGNFAIRTRGHLLKAGMIAVLIDAPSDYQSKKGLKGGFRNSTRHAKDIAAVVYYLNKTYGVPVWLHGTSRGTESVANAASSALPGLAGIVLSASVTESNSQGESILRRPLERVRVPVLVLTHKDDGCSVTPPEGTDKIAMALTNAPKVSIRTFKGGKKPKSTPCGAKSEHGFFGIEGKVLKAITTFIRENS